MLFQADVRQEPIDAILKQEADRAQNEPERMASWVYAREIVDGVTDHKESIDEMIKAYSEGWSLDRMPKVDLALLRMSAWEIHYNDEVPIPVAINEAVLLAGEYSTEDSGRFINGVLGNIAQHTLS